MKELRDGLTDTSANQELAWSAFDLSCKTPPGWRLQSQLLNAGDLSLTFEKERHWLLVRQIAVAHLALKRMPLAKWHESHRRKHERNYRFETKGDVANSRMIRRGGFWRTCYRALHGDRTGA